MRLPICSGLCTLLALDTAEHWREMPEKCDIFCCKWVKVNLSLLQLGTKVKDGNNKSLTRAESGIKGNGVYVSSLGVGER